MLKNSLEELYSKLAEQIYKNEKNRDVIFASTEPEKTFNDSLQTIFHRQLVLALMKKRNLPDVFGFNNNYPGSLFSNQIADSLITEDDIIIDITTYLDLIDINDIIYSHEKLKEIYYLINQDGTIQQTSEKRKNAGVFYTPAYIIDFILENSLGPLIADWKNRISSGNIDELADLLIEFKQLKILDPSCGSGVFLTVVAEKLIDLYNLYNNAVARHGGASMAIDCPPLFIATYNIHGVDIDRQVVEFAIYNLLTLLTDKNKQTHIRIYKQLVTKIKSFNFLQLSECTVGKFDLIIGNPPYVSNKELDPTDKKYIKDNYHCAIGQYDLIIPFMERSLNLLKLNGQVGFILPNKYMAADYGYELRKLIVQKYKMELLVDTSSTKIFSDASVYPVIQIVKKEKAIKPDNQVILLKQPSENNPPNLNITAKTVVPQSFFANEKFIITTEIDHDKYPILEKILDNQGRLDEKHIICGIAKSGFAQKIKNSDEYQSLPDEMKSKYKRIIQVKNIEQYHLDNNYKFIHQDVTGREQWQKFNGPKLLISGMAKELTAAIDSNDSALGRVYFIKVDTVPWDLYFLLGVLNSAVIRFFYKIFFWPVHLQGGYLRFNSTYLAQIPIPICKENNLSLFNQIISAARELESYIKQGRWDKDKQTEIDFLVGQVYGISEKKTKYIINLKSGGRNG